MLNPHVTRGPLVALMGGLLLVALLMLGAQDAVASHTCFPSPDDFDGDKLPDSCDPAAQLPDWDGDGFEDSLEIYVGTGPGIRCSFPADIDGSGVISGGDVFAIFPPWLATPDDPQWVQRYDIDSNEVISGGDVFTIFDVWIQECPTWFSPSTVTVELRSDTGHWPLAQVWGSSTAFLSFESSPFPTFCSELERAGSHWSNTTDFQFLLASGSVGSCINVFSNVRVKWAFLQCEPELCIHAKVTPFVSLFGRECTEGNPCHTFSWAAVLLNPNSSNMLNDANFRHILITHELGHVVGQGDIIFPSSCSVAPYTIMITSLDCVIDFDIHWPRPNDILFTNVKY